MKTLSKEDIEYLNKGTGLMRAVVADVLEADYPEEYIKDIAQNGCISGMVAGLVYYEDTTAFYEKHREDIWDLFYADMQSIGYNSIPEMIASLNGAKDVGSDAQLKNLLAWYGYERAISDIADYLERRKI